jgi:hypothetical protein
MMVCVFNGLVVPSIHACVTLVTNGSSDSQVDGRISVSDHTHHLRLSSS